jgi:hypothetical protein
MLKKWSRKSSSGPGGGCPAMETADGESEPQLSAGRSFGSESEEWGLLGERGERLGLAFL